MKKKKSGGGANWMDTYGDMVTLLLCFFVLLYSMSTIDTQKWILLVQSFNPDAVINTEEAHVGNDGPSADPPNGDDDTLQQQAQINQDMDNLYEKLKQYVEEAGAQATILVTKGEGRVFVSFNEAVFFGGNSYTIREESKPVLDKVAEILAQAANSIDELQIMGHTAEEVPGKPNDVTADRFLASNRATVVLIYLQDKNILPPERMVSVGYGEWRPVADNATSEGRALNRRVEMVVSGKNLEDEMGDSVQAYYQERSTTDPKPSTTPAASKAPAAAGASAAPTVSPAASAGTPKPTGTPE